MDAQSSGGEIHTIADVEVNTSHLLTYVPKIERGGRSTNEVYSQLHIQPDTTLYSPKI